MPTLDRTAVVSPAWRDRAGFAGVDVLRQPPGTLTLDQRADLRRIARRLKTSHDLAVAFAGRYAAFPGQLAGAELRELTAVRQLLARYGLSDPDGGREIGRFTDAAAQSRYEELLGRGSAGRGAALRLLAQLAGETAGTVASALARMTAPDVRHAYTQLHAAAVRQAQYLQAWASR
ncbi:DUF2202 domain-containing protein [Paractinoplanes atraurantiacus]|uniref:Uncharacterized protein domain n=1 Tax=Paractinoplanes atraurantiacus TaxID=1036182 RepID=A0A285JH54_9ACTN|nr:DUF2202 domain-containing protein [Actinoplanes atraurantiacus]SNY59127.1 Uncharacterized protein domain [Actinoplanes atraurantiacus]